jgi:hypothetical protein
MIKPEDLTVADVALLCDSLRKEPCTAYIRDLLIDCNRVQRAMINKLGAVDSGIPHWYYDTARARVAAAINTRAREGR